MCECCDEVVKRSVSGAVEQAKVRGKALDLRIASVAPKPSAPRMDNATSNERDRMAVEAAAAE
ncbi:hypothetical protein [Mesorhizobium sp.]|uniref:hypothetical protein n=1 Tax=Mesorhizobium sp. TaxID=1871066 RepID=UPI000FE7EB7C|nr:hypothetical protein [Mesorhizobium sp.]RWI36108.1 MAG: hypothetical protein EOR14_27870 [Mesorhizobium sp.]